MRVIRGHDAKWNIEVSFVFILDKWKSTVITCMDVLCVVLQIAVVGLDRANW